MRFLVRIGLPLALVLPIAGYVAGGLVPHETDPTPRETIVIRDTGATHHAGSVRRENGTKDGDDRAENRGRGRHRPVDDRATPGDVDVVEREPDDVGDDADDDGAERDDD